MRRFLYRLSIIIIAGWIVALLPSPTEAVPLRAKNGLVGLVVILGIGKLLYDTLFYDHYQQR